MIINNNILFWLENQYILMLENRIVQDKEKKSLLDWR